MLRDLFSLFPAYAGVIPNFIPYFAGVNAFPRICGGDPLTEVQNIMNLELFPAYAGVILPFESCTRHVCTFPRICGGDP